MRATSIAFPVTIGAIVAAAAWAAPAHAAVPTCHGVKATIVGTPRADVIQGTAHRDVIVGGGGNDTILARGGNDLVCGGSGADRLYGGAGSDKLYGGADLVHDVQEDGTERVGDTLRGGPGDDRLRPGVDRRPADLVVPEVILWDKAAHGVHIDLRTGTARGEGHDTFTGEDLLIVGSAHGDVVEGSDGDDEIYTGPGDDVVRGRGGDDYIDLDDLSSRDDRDQGWGGPGDDSIGGRSGPDRIAGGPGSDTLGGGPAAVLLGGEGVDYFGADLADSERPLRVDGGPGTDYLQLDADGINPEGAASAGTWDMATGAMTFTSDHEISATVLGIERPLLSTPGTSWRVTGTTGDDGLWTASGLGPVHFDALEGDDRFRGSDGDDVFDGGPGTDHSEGMGDGDDTCISVEVIDGSDCEHVTP